MKMTRLPRLGLFAALIAFFLAGRVTAADEAVGPQQTYAVIVGAGEFKDDKIKGRPTAESDEPPGRRLR